uniref:Uncharacterized protein n=1 Tax=Cucumis sativus TaxID=3659 RepID=A0A0A0L466_CUCSA
MESLESIKEDPITIYHIGRDCNHLWYFSVSPFEGFHQLLQGVAEVSDVENFRALDTKAASEECI